MTSKEFVIWLQGFVEAAHDYTPTPKQWDILKEKLAEVNDGTPIGEGGWGTPNTTPNWQWPHYPNPLDNPYRITCSSGSFGTITTTPGTGYITISNPNIASFGSGSFSITTSTATSLPSGSTITYTNTTEKIF
jgi:hypothetical protein